LLKECQRFLLAARVSELCDKAALFLRVFAR